jgi:hypothetical protein
MDAINHLDQYKPMYFLMNSPDIEQIGGTTSIVKELNSLAPHHFKK